MTPSRGKSCEKDTKCVSPNAFLSRFWCLLALLGYFGACVGPAWAALSEIVVARVTILLEKCGFANSMPLSSRIAIFAVPGVQVGVRASKLEPFGVKSRIESLGGSVRAARTIKIGRPVRNSLQGRKKKQKKTTQKRAMVISTYKHPPPSK